MHLAYNLSLVEALFYVNDTLSASAHHDAHRDGHGLGGADAADSLVAGRRRAGGTAAPGGTATSQATSTHEPRARAAVTQRLQRSARQAASAAYSLALLAQRYLVRDFKLALPVVQYVYTAECYTAGRLARERPPAADGGREAAARRIFKVPPRGHW